MTRLLCCELVRLAEPKRAAASLLCIVAACAIAFVDLEGLLSAAGASSADASALELFYAAANDSTAFAFFLPLGGLLLCGDAFWKDEENSYRDVVAPRLASRSSWWVAKTLCVLIASIVYALVALALMTAVCAVVVSPRLSCTPPEWVSYGGDPSYHDAFQRLGSFVALVPSSWNYPALCLAVALALGVICTAWSLLFAGVSACLPGRPNPAVLGAVVLLSLEALPLIAADVHFLLHPNVAYANWGFILDRLCLSHYCLGAGFFQTVVSQSLTTTYELGGVTYRETLATPVNSYVALVCMLVCAFALAIASLALRYRFGGAALGGKRAKWGRVAQWR